MSRTVQDETKQQRQVSPGDGMQLCTCTEGIVKESVEFEFGEMSSCLCSLICGPAKTTYVYHLSPSQS